MSADDEDQFYCVGALQVFEAKRILPRLEEAEVRFEIETDTSDIAHLPAAVAEYGTSGAGAKIRLYIHRDDEKKFRKISGEFFKL